MLVSLALRSHAPEESQLLGREGTIWRDPHGETLRPLAKTTRMSLGADPPAQVKLPMTAAISDTLPATAGENLSRATQLSCSSISELEKRR